MEPSGVGKLRLGFALRLPQVLAIKENGRFAIVPGPESVIETHENYKGFVPPAWFRPPPTSSRSY